MSQINENEAASRQFGFYAEPGECLFPKPISPHFRDSEFPELLRKTESVNDDRLLAIVSALVVEGRITRILEAFLPQFNVFDDNRDLTFALRTDFLKSLGFIPPQLLAAADCIRQIRNEFSHQLEKVTFEDVKQGLKDKLRDLFKMALPGLPETTRAETFRLVAFYCIAGLDMAHKSVQVLRRELQRPDFIQHVEKQIHVEVDEKWRAFLTAAPIREWDDNGWHIKEIEDGKGGVDVIRTQLPHNQVQ